VIRKLRKKNFSEANKFLIKAIDQLESEKIWVFHWSSIPEQS
jgi:hypothetical protein